MTWNHVYKQVTHFLTTKAIWSITSRTDGMISNSHSFRKLSLLNCGSILVISAIVFAVSDWENTSPEKLGNYWELINNMKTSLFKVAINTIYLSLLLSTWKLFKINQYHHDPYPCHNHQYFFKIFCY